FILAGPTIASNGQGSHIVITPLAPVFGQFVDFAWNGGGDDVSFNVTCTANTSTVPEQPVGTVVLSVFGMVMEDGISQPLTIAMSATANWTSGGADCSVAADIFSY